MSAGEVAAVLSATALSKTFDEGDVAVYALRHASLTLRAGEVVALEGPSGSGKSTLLSLLGCLLTPTSGTLAIGGATISRRSDLAAVRRRNIGFVFQHFNLIPALSALDNVAYPLRLAGASLAHARRTAHEALTYVGLAPRARFLPRQLSGGQKQRVAVARAIVTKPPLLLCDEPTANLDPASTDLVLSSFATLARERNVAVLISTHDPRARAVATRVLRMEAGVLVPSA